MDSVTLWLNTAGNRAIDRTETNELLARIARTDKDSKVYRKLVNKVIEGNLKLVYTTVKKYSDKRGWRWGTELSADLLQVGVEGLKIAVERFDVKKGSLSTIAVPWIRQRIGRYYTQKENRIYVPENLVREVIAVINTGKPTGTKYTPKNLNLIDQARAALIAPLSLDKPMGEDNDCTFGDMLEATDRSNTGERYDRELLGVRDLMARAGVEPRVQDLVIAYAERGNITIAAAKAGVKEKEARAKLNDAIERCKALV